MAKISIIIPVYNVEDYIDESFDSLLSQTEPDIEIIAVNDGSTDGSLDKLDYLAAKDNRIVIIDQDNAGPSAARNAGIEAATSPIIAFMDADDAFKPNTCERIIDVFQKEKTDDGMLDVLTFGADCFPKEAITPWHEDKLHPRDVVYEPFHPDLIFKESSRPFHWRNAISSEFLEKSGVRFDESLRLGEDQAFQFAIYPRANKTVLISDSLYDYRLSRKDSAMDQATSDRAKMMKDHLRIMQIIFADWNSFGNLEKYAPLMAAWTVEFMIYDTLGLKDPKRSELLAEAKKFLQSFWSSKDLDAMDIPKATKNILLAVVNGKNLSDLQCEKLRFNYYLQQYGIVSVVKSACSKVFGR